LSLSEEGCNMVVKLPKSSTFTWWSGRAFPVNIWTEGILTYDDRR
jgi:hypothetical protein